MLQVFYRSGSDCSQLHGALGGTPEEYPAQAMKKLPTQYPGILNPYFARVHVRGGPTQFILAGSESLVRRLAALPIKVPFHSIIGNRGLGGGARSSDGVVPYSSSASSWSRIRKDHPDGPQPGFESGHRRRDRTDLGGEYRGKGELYGAKENKSKERRYIAQRVKGRSLAIADEISITVSRSTLKPVVGVILKLAALWIALLLLPFTERTLLGARTYYGLFIGLGLIFGMYGLTIRSIFAFLQHMRREPVYVWIAFLLRSVATLQLPREAS
jgi:hypothetical protein